SLVGPKGDPGDKGDPGEQGPPGVGVPAGGAAGQVLGKATAADHDTQWIDPPTGGGAVSSVNGKTGDVVLTGDDIMFDIEGTPVSFLDVLEVIGQGFEDGLDTKADLYHTHNIEHVNGLQ